MQVYVWNEPDICQTDRRFARPTWKQNELKSYIAYWIRESRCFSSGC